MKKIAAALCVVPLFLSLNLISVSADPSAENSVNEITALEQEILEFADQCFWKRNRGFFKSIQDLCRYGSFCRGI